MVRLTIDGQEIQVPEGSTVLQASRTAGVNIPTLCEHPSLKPYGGCRLCVVEIEGARTLQASCTMPASNNMVVHTNTPKVLAARKFVLDLIFSERNHFCMYCQKSGGDCELQNAAYGEDITHWPIQPNWCPFPVDSTSPYFVLDHNRCILCRRCVRACTELVGNSTLSLENRGSNTMLVADFGLPIGESSCIGCGTCVQICPTGAFIDRSSAYLGLEKQTESVESICLECGLGCGTEVKVRDNLLVDINGNWNAAVNEGLLCRQGRYESDRGQRERLKTPLVRRDGALQPASWDEAYSVIAEQFKHNPVLAAASPRLPLEALAAFKELFTECLPNSNASVTDSSEFTVLSNAGLDQLKNADCVVVIGADLAKDAQVAGFFVKRNLPLGTSLILIDSGENGMQDLTNLFLKVDAGARPELLEAIAAALVNMGANKAEGAPDFVSPVVDLDAASQKTGISKEIILNAARQLARAEKPVIVLGAEAANNGSRRALEMLGQVCGATAILNLQGKANSRAVASLGLTGLVMNQTGQVAYLALGDDTPSDSLIQALQPAAFLAVQAAYPSALTERANVVLPVEVWSEQDGHYLNVEGRLQAAHQCILPPQGVLSNETVLRQLANKLDVSLTGDWQSRLNQSEINIIRVN